LTPVIGMNYYDVQVRGLSGSTVGGLVIPGIYNLNNSVSQATVGQIENNRRILGAYANLAFDWQDKVFLNYSARNDWSSTLPAGSQSFGYQAIGVSLFYLKY